MTSLYNADNDDDDDQLIYCGKVINYEQCDVDKAVLKPLYNKIFMNYSN